MKTSRQRSFLFRLIALFFLAALVLGTFSQRVAATSRIPHGHSSAALRRQPSFCSARANHLNTTCGNSSMQLVQEPDWHKVKVKIYVNSHYYETKDTAKDPREMPVPPKVKHWFSEGPEREKPTSDNTLELRAEWSEVGSLETINGTVDWVTIGAGEDKDLAKCTSGSTCETTDTRTEPINGRTYQAALHWKFPNGVQDYASSVNIVYVNWVEKADFLKHGSKRP